MPYGLKEIKTPNMVDAYNKGEQTGYNIKERKRKQPILEAMEQAKLKQNAQTLKINENNLTLQQGKFKAETDNRNKVIISEHDKMAAYAMGLPEAQRVEFIKQGNAQIAQESGESQFGITPENLQLSAYRGGWKDKSATDETAIPSSLTAGLSPNVAQMGKDAYVAAGGGTDGIKAFQSVVATGSELDKRADAPRILKESYPNASVAEMKELQASMDAGKTTESGFKTTEKIRKEQKRLKKAKGFQQRAITLLKGVLDSKELDNVVGGIEGSTSFRVEQSEIDLIADIEELRDLLTAENMSLMTGVLSESDIKILANLAGGSLNRKRGEDRFRKDNTTLLEKLSSKMVETVDDKAEKQSRETIDLSQTSDEDLLNGF